MKTSHLRELRPGLRALAMLCMLLVLLARLPMRAGAEENEVTDTTLVSDTQTVTGTESGSMPTTEGSGETTTKVDGETGTKVDGETDTKADGETDTKVDGETDTKVDGETDTKVDGETDTKVDGEPDTSTTDPAPAASGDVPSLTASSSGSAVAAGDEEPEAYSVPAGTAYILEKGKTVIYKNDADKGSAIQQGVEDALTYIKSLYEDPESPADRTATLVVSAGTYENGIDLGKDNTVIQNILASILGMSTTSDKKLTLRIVAEDALEVDELGEVTGFNADSTGDVMVEGDVNVLAGSMQLELVLAGLYLSTRGLVSVDSVDKLEIYGTQKDDYLTIQADNVRGSVTVKTGSGDDVVKLQISGQAAASASMNTYAQVVSVLKTLDNLSEESLKDKITGDLFRDGTISEAEVQKMLNESLEGIRQLKEDLIDSVATTKDITPIRVDVDTGSGDDSLKLNIADSTRLEMGVDESNPLMNQVEIHVDLNAYEITASAGDGNDRVEVTGQRDSTDALPLMEPLARDVLEALKKSNVTIPDGKITVYGGKGDDVVTIDNNVLLSTRGNTKVTVEGQDGFDRLHLTGKLNSDIPANDRIHADVNADGVEFSIKALAELKISDGVTNIVYKLLIPGSYTITTTGMESYTDALKNKQTVFVKDMQSATVPQAFTDYVVAADEEGNVSFDASQYFILPEEDSLLLTNILVRGEDDQLITIKEILAPNFNIIIDSDKTDVTGTIRGRSILILAYAEDKAIVEADANQVLVETGLDDDVEVANAKLGIYDHRRTIYIHVNSDAKLIAKEAVALSAILWLHHNFIPGVELLKDIDFNPVTLKYGDANIHIQGTIHAGGSVQISADVDIDVDVTGGDVKPILPGAVGVIGGSATVTVDGNADIRSGLAPQYLLSGNTAQDPTESGGILLRSDSTLQVLASAGAGSFPISLALAKVDYTTAVMVAGNAKLVAADSIRLLARNHLVTSLTTVGAATNAFAVKPSKGIFVAGSFADLTTTATIRDNATARALVGDVEVSAISRLSNNAVCIALPTQEKSLSEQYTTSKGLKFVKNVLETASYGSSQKDATPGLTKKDSTGKLSSLFDKSTSSAAKDPNQKSQILGAFTMGFLNTNTSAKIDTTGSVEAEGQVKVNALGEVRSQLRADGSLYRTFAFANSTTGGTIPNKAAGTGLALAIVENHVEAQIASGSIKSGGLDVQSHLGQSMSTLVAKSGHLPEETKPTMGIAGAIGVQVATYENDAAILPGAVIILKPDSSVQVVAGGSGWFVTVADASGKRTRKVLNLGVTKMSLVPEYTGSADFKAVGAGIAVDVIDITCWARIEDGVSISVPVLKTTESGESVSSDEEGDIGSLTVSASFTGSHRIDALAGVEGGKSLVPVLALGLSGMDVKAYVGTGEKLSAANDVTIQANGSMIRTVTANAQAAGVSVGLGAAVGVIVASDKVEASLMRSMAADNMTVDATSISRVTETVLASARGVTPAPGTGSFGQGFTPDKNATQEEVEKELSDKTEPVDEKKDKGGVDSLVDSLMASLSSLTGSQSTKKSGNLTEGNVNKLNSTRPAAATSEGNVQAAAAVAVNVQSNTVLARIGDGLEITTAKNLTITSRQDTDAILSANGSAVKAKEGIGAAVAVNHITYDNQALLGNGTTEAGGDITILATIVEDPEKRLLEEVMGELVTYLIHRKGIDSLLEKLAKDRKMSVEDLMESLLRDHYPEYASVKDKETLKEMATQEIAEMLVASLQSRPIGTSFTLAADVLESIMEDFRDAFADPDFFEQFLATIAGLETDLSNAIDAAGLDAKMTVASLRELLCLTLTQKFGNPSELDGIGCRISTTAISGEGASNVGVAGSAAVTSVDGKTLAQINHRSGNAGAVTAGGVVTIRSNGAQKVYTTATASSVANGLPDKNISSVKNNGMTNKSVGIGASFAMSQVDATANAILGKDLTLTAKALGVLASLQNDIDTIAVAGQDPIGTQQNTQKTYTGTVPDAVSKANNTTVDSIAADAAVALTLLNNTVKALVDTGCVLTLTGGNLLDGEGNQVAKGLYNLVARAYQRGQTMTNSSGFAVGKTAAVGASVALNITSSDVQAVVNGSGTITGKTLVEAETFNEDEVNALAMVTGMNLDRYLAYLRKALDKLNMTDKPSTGSINAKVAGAVNGKSGGSLGKTGNSSLPLSGMLSQQFGKDLPEVKADDKADDIYENGNKQVVVRHVGLKEEKSIWKIEDGLLTFTRTIANNKVGYLNMDVTSGTYQYIYDQHYIPYIRITNRTDLGIVLMGTTLENTNYVNPRVTTAGKDVKYTVNPTDITTPEVTVTSRGSGSITIKALIANPRGSVSFLWVGEEHGDLLGCQDITGLADGISAAPIWAHSLAISGAKNVGTEAAPFHVWLIRHDGDKEASLNTAAPLNVDANGNVWLRLTPVLQKTLTKDQWTDGNISNSAPFPDDMDITDITKVTSYRNVTVLLENGQRFYQLANTNTVSVPIPGSLEYVVDSIAYLSQNVTLDRTQLERYLESEDLVTGISVYYLPNGTRLYTNSDGEILRVQEGGVDFSLAEYKYDAKTNTVTLTEGVTFSLTTGFLNVADGYSYDALLSAISGKWLMERMKDANGTFQIRYYFKTGEEEVLDGDGIPQMKSTYSERDATLTLWQTIGTVFYYYASYDGAKSPDALLSNKAGEGYLLVYDTESDTIQTYLLTGLEGEESNHNRDEFDFVTSDSLYESDGSFQEITDYWGDKTQKVAIRIFSGSDYEYYVVKNVLDYDSTKTKNEARVIAASSSYQFQELAGVNFVEEKITDFRSLSYNEATGTWSLRYRTVENDVFGKPHSVNKSMTLSGITSIGDGFIVDQNAANSTDNEVAKKVYELLSGKIWKLTKQADDDTYTHGVAYWLMKEDENHNLVRDENGELSKWVENGYRQYGTAWYTLHSYYYTVSYISMEPLSLVLDQNGLIFQNPDKPSDVCNISIQGPRDDVQIKETTIPDNVLTGNNQPGYRITDDLYIRKTDGLAVLFKKLIQQTGDDEEDTETVEFVATYDAVNGTYTSSKVKLENLTRDGAAVYMPSITIFAQDKQNNTLQGTKLEAITGNGNNNGDIARDMQGRYYAWNGKSWTRIAYEVDTDGSTVDVVVDKDSNDEVESTTCTTTTIDDIVVKEYKVKLNLIRDTDKGLLAVRTVNGGNQYFLISGNQWSILTQAEAETLSESLETTGDTIDLTVYTSLYLKNEGKTIGSDGSVTLDDEEKTQLAAKMTTGTQYKLGTISGNNVTIRMEDAGGSLLNRNQSGPTITAKGNVVLETNSTGSIGTRNDPMRIEAEGDVIFKDLNHNQKLVTDAYLDSNKDMDLGDIVIDGTGQLGNTTLIAKTQVGSIQFNSMTVLNGGVVNLNSAEGIVGSKLLDISSQLKPNGVSSTVTMVAKRSIVLPETKAHDSILTVQSDADVTMGDYTGTGSTTTITAGNDSTIPVTDGSAKLSSVTQTNGNRLTVTTTRDISMGDYTGTGSQTRLQAGNDATLKAVKQLLGDSLTVTAAEHLSVTDTITSQNATLSLTATNGSMKLDKGSLTNGSSLNAQAGKNLTFGILEAEDSNLTLSAGGTLHTEAADGYLYFRNGQLSLSGKEAIGSGERYLVVDTDATIHIPTVGSYYLEALVLEGDDLYQRTRPQPKAQGSGRDEQGNQKAGELLKPNAATDTVYGELGIALNSDIAAMIVSRKEREEWIDLLTTQALTELIRSGTITSQNLEQTLVDKQDKDAPTKAQIDKLLTQGDTGYQALAQLLAAQLTAKKLDETGNPTTDYRLDDETVTGYLADSLNQDLVNIDTMAGLLTQVVTREELARMIENAWENADYQSHQDTRPADPEPRPLDIHVGLATGAAFVKNEGDITITQDHGTLTAGYIFSNREDVTLTAKNGSIQGNGDDLVDITGKIITLKATGGVGDETGLRIQQQVNEPTLVGNMETPTETPDGYENAAIKPLGASGKPTTEETKTMDPRVDWALETQIRFDWIRARYEERATQLNIVSGGDVNIAEQTGDLGLGTIQAAGNVTLTTPGSILDTRNGATAENIQADGDVKLTAESGTIGTKDAPITTDVQGSIRAQARGDISIQDSGDLDLVADSDEGQVNASAKKDLTLRNTQGDLVIGPITAGGTATIVAEGSLVEGDRYGAAAQVTAKSIDLTAKNGTIGTRENPFDVDTDGGTFSAIGTELVIAELDGDLNLKRVQAETDAVLTAPGSILDANANASDEAKKAQQAADNAQAAAEAAQADAFVKEELAARAEEAQKKAQEAWNQAYANTDAALEDALNQAKDTLSTLTPGTDAYAQQQNQVEKLEKQLKTARKEKTKRDKALQQAQEALDKAEAENAAAQAEAMAARAEADEKAKLAASAQKQADDARAKANGSVATVTTGNDLTLEAGDSIGAPDRGLSVEVGGTITATAGDSIHISGKGDLRFNEIQVPGQVGITTVDGDITGSTITAGSLDVSAVNGDVGRKDAPLEVSTDHVDAMGNNVYLRNDKDLEIGQISAKDNVELEVKGNVTADPTAQKPNIIADDLTIRAEGSIGTDQQPLDTSVDGFHGQGSHIHLDNHSKDLDISDVTAGSLHVTTDGNVTGKDNTVTDITIWADGYVGKPEDPFTFYAPGHVDIHGALGTWLRNLYTAPHGHRFQSTLVLRFDVELGGQRYSLYVLVGLTQSGKLQLIGWFLCQGTATEALWTQVLTFLKTRLHVESLGLVIMDGEDALIAPAASIYGSTCQDVSLEGETLAEAIFQEVETLSRQLQKLVDGEYPNQEALLEAVDQLAETFTAHRTGWMPWNGPSRLTEAA